MGYTKIHKKHFDRRKLTFEPLELENNINVAFTNYDISLAVLVSEKNLVSEKCSRVMRNILICSDF